MLFGVIKWLVFLFYVPEKQRTCENGFHKWSFWFSGDSDIVQHRACSECGKVVRRVIF